MCAYEPYHIYHYAKIKEIRSWLPDNISPMLRQNETSLVMLLDPLF